ncbi:MAG: carboxymuconolactone decarboxylase family protein [Planctomycetota bacterium]
MPHVPPLAKQDAPKEAQPILSAIEKNLGQILNIFGTLAYQPDVLEGVTKINDGIRNDLPDKLRELAYYKSSQVNDCDYCSHYHRGLALKAGATEEQIEAIGEYATSDAFDQHERAVLAYAEELTETGNVRSATVEKVKEFLDDKQLVTLAATIGLANFTNRFNHGLGIELP